MDRSNVSTRALLIAGLVLAALVLLVPIMLELTDSYELESERLRAAAEVERIKTELEAEARTPVPDRVAASEETPEREVPGFTVADLLAAEGAFAGILLDSATEERIPYLQLVAGDLICEVDGEGRFEADHQLHEDVGNIEFHDRYQGTHIRTIDRDSLEPDEDGWIARIAIGPTFRLNIVDAGGIPMTAWRARLVELRADGTESRGSWIRVHDFDPPFMRYDNPWGANVEHGSYRVDVRTEDGTRFGSSGLLASAIGIYPELVSIVADRELATAKGRVVNALGEGVRGTRVTLFPTGASGLVEELDRWPATDTDTEGYYRVQGLVPGRYHVHIRPRRGEKPQGRDEHCRAGINELADFVIPVQKGAGMIEGILASESGMELAGQEIVRLRAVDGRDFELFDVSSSPRSFRRGKRGLRFLERQPDGKGHVFEFNEVPEGEYELSVVSQGAYSWTPARVLVQPPNDEVKFVRRDNVARESYEFQVTDQETGERVESFQVRLQSGDAWNPYTSETTEFEVPAGVDFEWTVIADGYRLARGGRDAFESDGKKHVARVELERGWGARLVLRDLLHGFGLDDNGGRVAAMERPPVAGAVVVCDGEVAGESDERGAVELRLEREPRSIEIRAKGWRVVPDENFRDGRLIGSAREVVIWLLRE